MKAIIALGSNLGDRAGHLHTGLKALAALGPVSASPRVLESADESGIGPIYLNTVALLHSALEDPRRLLEALLRIELRAGRDRRTGRNAPRTLDLDLITVERQQGAWRWPTPVDLSALGAELELVLPHPRAAARPFVTEPLAALLAILSTGEDHSWAALR